MFYVYLLRCESGALYAGITTDPSRRLREHQGERRGGARYTALDPPRGFAVLWTAPDRAAATKLEYRLKRLPHARKERLAAGEPIPDLLPEGCQRTMVPSELSE